MVGVTTQYGRQAARETVLYGMLNGSKRMADPDTCVYTPECLLEVCRELDAEGVADRLRPAEAKDPHGVAEARQLLETAYDEVERRMSTRAWATGTCTCSPPERLSG